MRVQSANAGLDEPEKLPDKHHWQPNLLTDARVTPADTRDTVKVMDLLDRRSREQPPAMLTAKNFFTL